MLYRLWVPIFDSGLTGDYLGPRQALPNLGMAWMSGDIALPFKIQFTFSKLLSPGDISTVTRFCHPLMRDISDHGLEMFQLTPPPYWRAARTACRQKAYDDQNLDRTEYAEDHFTGCSGGSVYKPALNCDLPRPGDDLPGTGYLVILDHQRLVIESACRANMPGDAIQLGPQCWCFFMGNL